MNELYHMDYMIQSILYGPYYMVYPVTKNVRLRNVNLRNVSEFNTFYSSDLRSRNSESIGPTLLVIL